jgi:mannose-6-phosphate isomerase-like protein (cupin superfamily)
MTWFIRNIRDVQWYDAGDYGIYGDFEQGERFPEFGFNFGVAWPGQPGAMYHRDDHQEGFLVLSGEVLLIVEGEERILKGKQVLRASASSSPVKVVPS